MISTSALNRSHLSFLAYTLLSCVFFSVGCQKGEMKKPMSINPPQVEVATGKVTINGADSNAPKKPFSWNWGDGKTEEGWFPMTHVYSDTQKDYQVTITAHYEGDKTGQAKTTVSFKMPK
jgi:hypothetical protein